jgi:topoisomerase-4 subunit A
VKADDVLAQTKSGKQVLNVSGDVKAKICKYITVEHDHLAVMGQNRKMLVFPLNEIPEMGRGKGVILQKYKDGGVSDVKSFALEAGLEFRYGTGMSKVEDIVPWMGKRASAGRMPPNGFPKNNLFG